MYVCDLYDSNVSWVSRWQLLLPIVLCPVAFISLIIVVICLCYLYARRRHALPEPDMTSSHVCWSCLGESDWLRYNLSRLKLNNSKKA